VFQVRNGRPDIREQVEIREPAEALWYHKDPAPRLPQDVGDFSLPIYRNDWIADTADPHDGLMQQVCLVPVGQLPGHDITAGNTQVLQRGRERVDPAIRFGVCQRHGFVDHQQPVTDPRDRVAQVIVGQSVPPRARSNFPGTPVGRNGYRQAHQLSPGLTRQYFASDPASTGKSIPVIIAAAGEARNTTALP
jgi:hypothetical protein